MTGKKAWMPPKRRVAEYLSMIAHTYNEEYPVSYVQSHMIIGYDDYEAHYMFQGRKRQYTLHIDKWGNQLR